MSATYSPATLKRHATMQRKIEAQMRRERATQAVKRTVEQDRDAAMAKKPATSGQMRRINRLHEAQGLREYATLAAFRKVFPTMLAASLYWRQISA